MSEIAKAQEKVVMDAIVDLAVCINQGDYVEAESVLEIAQRVLLGLNAAAYA